MRIVASIAVDRTRRPKKLLASMIGLEDVTELPWTEIDFPEDVERAASDVLPAIARFETEREH